MSGTNEKQQTSLNDLFPYFVGGWTPIKMDAANQYLNQNNSSKQFDFNKADEYLVYTVKEIEYGMLRNPSELENFLKDNGVKNTGELMKDPRRNRWVAVFDQTDGSINLINPNKEFTYQPKEKPRRIIQKREMENIR